MASSSSEAPKVAKKILYYAFFIFLLAIYYSLPGFGVDVPTPKINLNDVGTYYEVTKIIDGDTIQINMNGNLEKVRLIGINTPEIAPNQSKSIECFGKEASDETNKLLDGQIIRFEYDNSQSIRDAYDRILAYVYMEDGEMVNRKLLANGYAYEYTYMTPYKYQKEFRDLQNFARTQGRGLWSTETCNGSKIIK